MSGSAGDRRGPRRSRAWYRLAPFLFAAAATCGAALAETFPLPGPTGWTTWSVQQARQDGLWEAKGPADGARFLQPKQAGAALDFPVTVAVPTMLRLRPVWWPTGEQKLARRFPYPLVRQFGPEALAAAGGMVFATAPAAGRVIVINPASEQIAGAMDVGGYVADVIADPPGEKVYAADALGGRVVEMDARTLRATKSIAVSGGPWALAWHDGLLYVACREGKKVVAVSPARGEVVREVALPAEPISLETSGGALLVRFQQQTYDIFSLTPAPAGEQQYGVRQPDPLSEGRDDGFLTVEREKDPGRVDLSEVTGYHLGSGPPEMVAERVDVRAVTGAPDRDAGPRRALTIAVGNPLAHLVFFLSPSRGRVGVYDMEARSLRATAAGGYLSDLALLPAATSVQTASAAPEMLYVADSAGGRVLELNPRTQQIERTFRVPGGPWRVAAVREVTWQEYRDQSWPFPPKRVDRLYVTCRTSGDMAVIDLAAGKVMARVPLPAEPRGIGLAPMPDPSWWGLIADDRIHLRLQPRIAVEIRPLLVSLPDLKVSPAPLDTPEEAPRHDSQRIAGNDGAKEFQATNALTVGVDGKRWVDLSGVADPQRMPDRPLSGKETPGSITISVDGGPAYDWAAGIWQAPDSELFLVNESESYWRYNAPRLLLSPGRHVIRVTAHSPYVRLQGLAAARSPEPTVELTVTPLPAEVHARVPLISYGGVFYDQEPVSFAVQVTNHSAGPVAAQLSCALKNYMGEEGAPSQSVSLELRPGADSSQPFTFTPRDTGRFTLRVKVSTEDGEIVKEVRFLRLPKLEHPRLLFRKDDLPAIEARIARYPNLFRRYADWLERMSQKEGRFPQRFLPPGLTTEECMALAPAEIANAYQRRIACAHRQYELGWRLIASQFAADYLKPHSARLEGRLEPLLTGAETTDMDSEYHYHGVFFAGSVAALLDLVPQDTMKSLKLYDLMASRPGDMNLISWTLLTLEEPLTPQKRALIYRIMTLENNAEQYFETHHGRRGGTWWEGPYTSCSCPMTAYTMMFVELHSLFGEPCLFEKPFFGGYLTLQRYIEPLHDNRNLQPNHRGPNSEPWHWLLAALSRHPLEQSFYQWDDWVRRMEGPLPGDEQAAVDKLMSLDSIALSGPLGDDANYFVSGVSVPIALALGWYDPESARVKLPEMPSTGLFDVDGWVAMRSDWSKTATEVDFVSGATDHTSRTRANHFTVVKSGEYLIGTPVLLPDDGNTVGSWANSVVVGDQWRQDWAIDMEHSRGEEHQIIDRFSHATLDYLDRDAHLTGYRAAEDGWGGGLDLHGHQESFFKEDGRLIAYQTWPHLDFVAGDASNSWPLEEVSQIDRQMVFLKPDLLVIYDRVKLGPEGHTTGWVAATGPQLSTHGDTFRVGSGDAVLLGRVLLPEKATVAAPTPMAFGWTWKDQRYLEIRPSRQTDQVEYLVVMRIGDSRVSLPEMQLLHDDHQVGVRLTHDGRPVEIRLNRAGPVGGTVTDAGDSYDLHEVIEDNYDHWRSDSRWREWSSEPRFRFMVPRGESR